jgi:hypothetical protein
LLRLKSVDIEEGRRKKEEGKFNNSNGFSD